MKKHKSVVAILLAVMMIFTMMPMMAFAAEPDATKIKWADDFSTVTVPAYQDGQIYGSDGTVDVPQKTYKTVRLFIDGIVVAMIDPAEQAKYNWELPEIDNEYYFDLSSAELANADSISAALKSEYGYGSFDPASVKYIVLKAPSYAANATKDYVVNDVTIAEKASAATISFDEFETYTKWKGEVVGADAFDKTARTEQTLKLSFGGSFTDAQNPEEDYAIVGTIPEKEVKILAATKDPNYDAKYYFDAEDDRAVTGTSATQAYSTWYDGATHTFMVSAVEGWTPAFFTLDRSTGKWTAATAVTLSDVQEKATEVKVEWTKDGTQGAVKKTHMFSLNLDKAGTASLEFTPGEEGFAETVYSVSGTQYDAKGYVVPVAVAEYTKGGNVALKLKDAATAKAVEANKADLIAYFGELYDVEAVASKRNPNCVELEIVSKDLTAKEKEAIDKKYAALLARVSVSVDEDDYAYVALNGVDLSDYEIEFTQAPAKKVIKTKKSKSTKKVTFNVKAECKNGTVVKYKLINAPKKSISIDANTGKITVKKGLAKGTYTFKVKAYVTGSNNLFSHTTESEVQTIKVVVKKVKK